MGYDRAIADWGILRTALMQPTFSEKSTYLVRRIIFSFCLFLIFIDNICP